MVQRPTDLDTACSLALLQEEVTERECISPTWQPEHRYIKFPLKPMQVQTVTSPSTPSNRPSDTRRMEAARQGGHDWLAQLRNYRREKGLCFKCGEKWNYRDHVCPQSVQLHVVEELLAVFSQEEITGTDSPPSSPEPVESNCSISVHALIGAPASVPSVIQLQAFITNHEVLILIDSGGSTLFVNAQLAAQLPRVQPLSVPCRVNVADGAQHKCFEFIPACQWTSQGHQFSTDLKVLPLGAYDVILGMDWLE